MYAGVAKTKFIFGRRTANIQSRAIKRFRRLPDTHKRLAFGAALLRLGHLNKFFPRSSRRALI